MPESSGHYETKEMAFEVEDEDASSCSKKACQTVPEKRCFRPDDQTPQQQSYCQEVPMEDCTVHIQSFHEHMCVNVTSKHPN